MHCFRQERVVYTAMNEAVQGLLRLTRVVTRPPPFRRTTSVHCSDAAATYGKNFRTEDHYVYKSTRLSSIDQSPKYNFSRIGISASRFPIEWVAPSSIPPETFSHFFEKSGIYGAPPRTNRRARYSGESCMRMRRQFLFSSTISISICAGRFVVGACTLPQTLVFHALV